jgi:hypothetical protein
VRKELEIALEQGNCFIPVRNEKEQESLRVTLFNDRRLQPPFVKDSIGIRKETVDGALYVKVFKRDYSKEFLVMKEGRLGPLPAQSNPEVSRHIKVMLEDGLGLNEINTLLDINMTEEELNAHRGR